MSKPRSVDQIPGYHDGIPKITKLEATAALDHAREHAVDEEEYALFAAMLLGRRRST